MQPFSVTEALVSWLASMGYEAIMDAPSDAGEGAAASDMPDEFVTVERTGGGVRDMIDRPLVAVQCWALTGERAEALANEVRLRVLTERPPAGVHSVRLNAGPYKFNDEATRRPRWQMALDVACQLVN